MWDALALASVVCDKNTSAGLPARRRPDHATIVCADHKGSIGPTRLAAPEET
jgi:hypothetical protein